MTISARRAPVLLSLLLTATGLLAAAPAGAAEPGPAAAPYDVRPFRARASDDDRLERAWKAWLARGDRRYSTVVDQSCFCPPQRPVVTRVEGRTVTSVTRQGSSIQLRRHGHAVPDLFRLLRRAYREADEVEVRYRKGVPVSIYVDWDRRVADEESALSVRVR